MIVQANMRSGCRRRWLVQKAIAWVITVHYCRPLKLQLWQQHRFTHTYRSSMLVAPGAQHCWTARSMA